MNQIASIAICTLLLAACSRDDRRPPPSAAAQPRPPVTHIPGEARSVRAQPLLTGRFDAARFTFGPHALARNPEAWHRLWRASGQAAPHVDFRSTNVLARRVFNTTSVEGAAPHVSSRGGMTFVVLPAGAGPPRPSGADFVVFYRIPVAGGPVRYISYAATR